MSLWLQNLAIVLLAALAAAVVIWQAVRTLRGKGGGIGSCCSKGCGQAQDPKKPAPQVVFFPADMLRRRK